MATENIMEQMTFDLIGEVYPMDLVRVEKEDTEGFAFVTDGVLDDLCTECTKDSPMQCRVHGIKLCEALAKHYATQNGFPEDAVSVKSLGGMNTAVKIKAHGDDETARAQVALQGFFSQIGLDGSSVDVFPKYVYATFSRHNARTPSDDGLADFDDSIDKGKGQQKPSGLSSLNSLYQVKDNCAAEIEGWEDELCGATEAYPDIYDANIDDFLKLTSIRRKLKDKSSLTEKQFNAAVRDFGEERVAQAVEKKKAEALELYKYAKRIRDKISALVKDAEAKRLAQEVAEKASNAGIDERLTNLARPLTPLEHDESKFPESLTSDMVESADYIGEGSTGACLLELDGRKYVMKAVSRYMGECDNPREHIENEYYADCAYRANGIRVPDCKLYEVDGELVKLSEYIDNAIPLRDYMEAADDEHKDEVREDLLAGYPLDAYFGNWDVIGLEQDNVLIDEEGNAWRVDNGSCFGFRSRGGKKAKGAYEERQFPDEWRTLREKSNNEGVFDKYTANDIFTSAAKFDFAKVYAALPEHLRIPAMEKCATEMQQMADRCTDHNIGGYGGKGRGSSDMLEASYDLSKLGFREACPASVSDEKGFGTCRTEDNVRLEDGSRSIVEMGQRYISKMNGLRRPKTDSDGVAVDTEHPLYFLQSGMANAGYDSWHEDACKMRIAEIALRGGDWRNMEGEGRSISKANDNQSNVEAAIDFYKRNPDLLERDMKSLAVHKAMTQLFLENTKCAGNDKKNRTLFVVRSVGKSVTERKEYNTDGYHIAPDSFVRYKTSGMESTSVGKRTAAATGYDYGGGTTTATETMLCAVPYSRVVGGYWFERSGGHGRDCFYESVQGAPTTENEVLADVWNAPYPLYYCSDSTKSFADYQKLYRKEIRSLMRGYNAERTDVAALREFSRSWDKQTTADGK